MVTVFDALKRLFPDSSKATLRSWIKQGRVVVDGQRVVPERLQELGYKFKYPELEPALRDLLVS